MNLITVKETRNSLKKNYGNIIRNTVRFLSKWLHGFGLIHVYGPGSVLIGSK